MINSINNNSFQTLQSTSIQNTANNNSADKSNTGLSAAQAKQISAQISQLDPATLFNAGANRTTGFAQALSLVD
ncbi:hypothetical protein HR060_17605 [Catenovulum sp. SM1970]|uniref:hypothetical protein n=1 Tax=Marinifaba aquimaris TaxID=2741323 RepID=UPI0015720527|nr:hypothetical protein [Marinifaba aquimaris]NTS78662.1 hypothetical protein [Marinifaba aquimaris]